jgi:hypothetical protein
MVLGSHRHSRTPSGTGHEVVGNPDVRLFAAPRALNRPGRSRNPVGNGLRWCPNLRAHERSLVIASGSAPVRLSSLRKVAAANNEVTFCNLSPIALL